MSVNKQISVWRGQTPPPTVYHLWVYNNEIRKYSDGEWVNISTDRELMAKYLYSTRIRLSNAEDISHINIQSYTPDDKTQTYKYKGRVVIPVPLLGTYAVLIRLTGFENESLIITGDKIYNVEDVVSLRFSEVNTISFELTKYCYIKEILVLELTSLDVIASSVEDLESLEREVETLSDKVDNIDEELDSKQEHIEDIEAIREGAAKGETALQEGALKDYYTKEEISSLISQNDIIWNDVD